MTGDKRRGGSASHVLHTTPAAPAAKSGSPAAAAASSLSSASSSSSSLTSNPSAVISPPSRAALSSSANNVAAAPDDAAAARPSRTGMPGRAHRDGSRRRSRESRQSNDDDDDKNNKNNSSSARSAASRSRSLPKDGTAGEGSASEAALKRQVHHLERELETMEAEFRQNLDKLSHNESEAASFWQARHSGLNQDFIRADAELRAARAELEDVRCERDDLRAGWDATRRELAGREREAAELRSQVRGLKDWLATSTRAAGVAPADDVFVDGFSRLFNGLQNWLINNFRRVKLDLSQADEGTLEELAALVPTYAELAGTSKLQMLQSLVSRILVEMIFDSYFVGLTEQQALQLAQAESVVESLVTGPEPLNQWRSTTLTLLSKEAAHKMHDETARLADSVVWRINRLLGALSPDYHATSAANSGGGGGSSSSSNNNNNNNNNNGAAAAAPRRSSTPGPAASSEASLRQLIASSVELARLLAVQRASFHVFMPEVLPPPPPLGDAVGGLKDGEAARRPAAAVVVFDPTRMEDVGGLDEEALAGAVVRCATFPGIVKRGDEAGGHLQQYENVIAKARVLCNPG